MSSDVTGTIDFSYTAPELPSPMVFRPHLIETLVRSFDLNTEIVCVEGKSGYGKTTLLREFAEKVDAPCFMVFLKAASRFSYDPVLARSDMANQAQWFLKSESLADDNEPTDGDLRELWRKCARRLSRSRKHGYIIIDGIHHVPPEEESTKHAIMNLLPFGVKPFRFLFSGDADNDIFFDNKKLRVKSFPVSPFSPHEADEYLQDLIEDKSLRSKYYKALGGVPLLLATARHRIATSSNQEGEISPDSAMDIESLWDIAGPFRTTSKSRLVLFWHMSILWILKLFPRHVR